MRIQKESNLIPAKLRAALEDGIVHCEKAIKIYRSVLAEDAAERAEGKAAKLLSQWAQADMYL